MKILRLVLPSLIALIVCLGTVLVLSATTTSSAGTSVVYAGGARFVATTGSDTGDCTDNANPCATIQYAVDAADGGDEIRVASGVYSDVHARSGITQLVYISKSVNIAGGYTTTNWAVPELDPSPTVLDAGGAGRGLTISGPVSATIQRVRVTGGQADSGAGMMVDSANVTLKDSVFLHNISRPPWGSSVCTADHYGGAIFLLNSSGTLVRNTIYENFTAAAGCTAAGGGIAAIQSTLTLNGNSILYNTVAGDWILVNSYGGGLYLEQSQTTVSGNFILNNKVSGGQYAGIACGGGVAVVSGTATLAGNTIGYNSTSAGSRTSTAYGGGVCIMNSPALLSENDIHDNTATGYAYLQLGAVAFGGGVYLDGDRPTLSGNHISHNHAIAYARFNESRGGGIYLRHDESLLVNNVIGYNGYTSQTYTNTVGRGSDAALVLSQATLVNNVIQDSYDEGTIMVYVAQSNPRFLHTTLSNYSPPFPTALAGCAVCVDISGTLMMTNTIIGAHNIGISVTKDAAAALNGILWYANGINVMGNGTITSTYAYTVETYDYFESIFRYDGYHLARTSPAVDRGLPTGVATDIDGDARPFGAAPDLGADEYVGPPPTPPTHTYLPLISR